jgi:hypothetical protein
MMEIEVKHRPMTQEEIGLHGLRGLVGTPEHRPPLEGEADEALVLPESRAPVRQESRD